MQDKAKSEAECMTTCFMDESGYTGYDLLNRQQPFQGASSVEIAEDMASFLVDEYFPRSKLSELKHRLLSRRENNWKPLLELQHEIIDRYNGMSYVCDKKYLLLLMFLDNCVEPYLYDNGLNFYHDGYNYVLASQVYWGASKCWGKGELDVLLGLYQRSKKFKNSEEVYNLIIKANELQDKPLGWCLKALAKGYKSCLDEILSPRNDTDASLIPLIALISHIEKKAMGRYEIVHDESKSIDRCSSVVNGLMGVSSEKSFKHTAITTLSFPLKLTNFRQMDSKASCGIQLADILIGGMIEYLMSLFGVVPKNDYNQGILGLYNDFSLIHLLPSIDSEKEKKFREGTQGGEFIDFITGRL